MILPIKPRTHIRPCSLPCGISKEIWIQTYLELVTVDSVEFSHHFALWRHGTRLDSFFLIPMDCIFGRAFFKFTKIWIPLLHPSNEHYENSRDSEPRNGAFYPWGLHSSKNNDEGHHEAFLSAEFLWSINTGFMTGGGRGQLVQQVPPGCRRTDLDLF